MVKRSDADLRRAVNFRTNLRRIFDAWGNQSRVAQDAGIHRVYLARLIRGDEDNPTINTIEAISQALEISVETLLATDPPDADLRIVEKIAKQTA